MSPSSSSSEKSDYLEDIARDIERQNNPNQRVIESLVVSLDSYFEGRIANLIAENARQRANLLSYASIYSDQEIIHEEAPLARTLTTYVRTLPHGVMLDDASSSNVFHLLSNDVLRCEMIYTPHVVTCNSLVIDRGGESFQGKPINIIPRSMSEYETEEVIYMHPYPGMSFVYEEDSENENDDDGDCGELGVNGEDDYEDGFYRDAEGKVIYKVLAHEVSDDEKQEVKYYAGEPWLVKHTKSSEAMNVIFRNLHTGVIRRYILSHFEIKSSFMLGNEFYYIRYREGDVDVVECRSGQRICAGFASESPIISCRDYAVYSNAQSLYFITMNTRPPLRIHERIVLPDHHSVFPVVV